jgi:hypothetical protein
MQERVGQRDAHRPCEAEVVAVDPPLERGDEDGDGVRGLEGLLAGGGGGIAVGGALEEAHAESLLERAETAQHSRVADAERACGAAHRALTREHERVAQVIPESTIVRCGLFLDHGFAFSAIVV